MSITSRDLANFHTFVTGKLTSGSAGSLVELAREWEAERREFDETVAERRECLPDNEAGNGRLLSDSVAEMRRKYSIPTRDA